MPRHEFSQKTKQLLANQVGHKCSRSGCPHPTSGPHTDDSSDVNVGVAAHITAASPNGPRYDPALSEQQRRHASNGIWLCQTCAKLVDSDPERFSADLLRQWKDQAKEARRREVEGQERPGGPAVAPVPELPFGAVRRTTEFNSAKSLLLESSGQGITNKSVALVGPGGYGKTTLAAALCHNEELRKAWTGGILWVTLGEHADALVSLTLLHRQLSGDRTDFPTVESAVSEMRALLENRPCFLVIDDVWNAGDLRPLLACSIGCTRLITTRMLDLAVDMKRIEVAEMTEKEASELLIGNFDIDSEQHKFVRKLANRLGYAALALELAHSTISRRIQCGEVLDSALGYLNSALSRKGVVAFDARRPIERRDAIRVTIELSRELLTEQERIRHLELCVFSEEDDVPLTAVIAMWSQPLNATVAASSPLDEVDAECIAMQLHEMSLLNLNLETRTVRLHSLMRSYLVGKVDDLPRLHARLVHAWGAHPGEDEFAWKWLGHHLVAAGHRQKLAELLLDYTWLRSKLRIAGIASLLADLSRAGDAPSISTLSRALHQAAHILAEDELQLPSQLHGRLLGASAGDLQRLLETSIASTHRPVLKAMVASLDSPHGPLLKTTSCRRDRINAIATLPNDTKVLAAASDSTLALWNLTDDTESIIGRHKNSVTCVAVSSDGKFALSGSTDNTVRLWRIADRTELLALAGHEKWIEDVCIAPDGQWFASAALDGTIRVWDIGGGLQHVLQHDAAVHTLAIMPDGQRLLSGCGDGQLCIWNAHSFVLVGRVPVGVGSIKTVAVSPDGSRALLGSQAGALVLTELSATPSQVLLQAPTSNERRRTIGAIAAAVFSSDNHFALTASWDNRVRYWDLRGQRLVSQLEGHSGAVTDVSFSANDEQALSSSWDGTIRRWSLREPIAHRTDRHGDVIGGVALSKDGRLALSASWDGSMSIWNSHQGTARRTFKAHEAPIKAIALSPQADRFVTGAQDGTLKVWALADCSEERTVRHHGQWVTSVAISTDGKLALSGARDSTAKLWTLEDGSLMHVFRSDGNCAWRQLLLCIDDNYSCASVDRGPCWGGVALW